MKRILLIILIGVMLFPCAVKGQNIQGVKTSTDILLFVPSVVGFCKVMAEEDYQGLWQLAASDATAVALAYLLKYTVPKERPDGSDSHSFCSNHAAASFAGAAFLQRRYGWAWGAPAYAVAAYVSWGRVYSQRHDWWDVILGAAIGVGSAYIYTKPFSKKYNVTIAPLMTPEGGCGVYFAMNF